MLALVNPRISICWDMYLLHSLWRNSLAQGRLVMRTVASGSSLPCDDIQENGTLVVRNFSGSSSYPSNRRSTPLPPRSLDLLNCCLLDLVVMVSEEVRDVLCSSHTLVSEPQEDNQLVLLEQLSLPPLAAQFPGKGRLSHTWCTLHKDALWL